MYYLVKFYDCKNQHQRNTVCSITSHDEIICYCGRKSKIGNEKI